MSRGYKYFSDGIRRVDFVLLHSDENAHDEPNVEVAQDLFEPSEDRESREFREKFLDGIQENEQVEIEQVSLPGTDMVCTLCHLPPETAFKMADKTKLLLPLAADTEEVVQDHYDFSQRISDWAVSYFSEEIPWEIKELVHAQFDMRDTRKFLNYDHPDKFLSSANRSYLLYSILDSVVYGERNAGEIGIKRMVADGHFTGAFALHSGPREPLDTNNLRSVLKHYWGSPKKFWKAQPLDHIRMYFGSNVAFYFLWLGFYTRMMISLAALGFLIFLYSVFSIPGDTGISFVCNSNIRMCPLCDECHPYNLSDECVYAYVDHIADNNSIVVYAIFVSIWSLVFVKLWRRTQASYAFKWHVFDKDEEFGSIRPQYAALATSSRPNPVTNEVEPHFPGTMKTMRTISAFSILLVMVLVVITFIVMCIFYRVFIATVFKNLVVIQPTMLASVSAAFINLLFIMLCNFVYNKLAIKLTDWEMHRTEEAYDDSLTLKSYIFQFVTYYSSIIYIGFVKGKFAGTPDDHKVVLGTRPEQCTGSCMVELALQMTIIMIGQQLYNNFMEIFTPVLMRIWSRMMAGYHKKKERKSSEDNYIDGEYNLLEEAVFKPDFNGLFWEYLEMVIQFGFCTIFVIALPLAPLFALLNNVAEIRIDAHKLLEQVRRPITKVVKDIGAWEKIIELISVLAVIANGCLIAFTSDFIPRQVYYHHHGTMDGYYNHTLIPAVLPDEGLDNSVSNSTGNITCYYKNDVYAAKETGSMTEQDWEILFWKLSFLVLFEHFMLMVAFLVEWGINDRPWSLTLKLKRRRYMQSKHLKEHL